jgi:ribosomal protein S7
MNKKSIEIKKKIVNHIMFSGKKKTSEKLLLKSVKELNKSSKKQIKKLVQLRIIYTTPIFKLHISTNKKQKKRNRKIRILPSFVPQTQIRTSLALRFILANIKKKKSNTQFYQSLKQAILQTSKQEKSIIEMKNEIQKKALLNKRYFRYYRWT